jgi:hypothetical protein
MSEEFVAIVNINDTSGIRRITLDGRLGAILMNNANRLQTIALDGRTAQLALGAVGSDGHLKIIDDQGTVVFNFNAQYSALELGGTGNEGDLFIRDDAGNITIHLDGGNGDIKLLGADLAEDFTSSAEIVPGTVVVALGVDEISVADKAGDRRVIGIAAGAGGLRPALRLGCRPGKDRIAVAVAGRAYCKADATHGRIDLGDLLMSSPTPGHAMRVDDPSAAAGAIIGKALSKLEHGTGLIPVLLALR